jgi:hypothetical protein
MMGHLTNTIISDFENSFRTNCLILIGEAYNWLKENKCVSADWNEETISANIFTYIDESEKAISWNISISDECRLYNQTILNNKKSAKSAPRIDLKLTTNWIKAKKRIVFFVEAKSLIENNCLKTNRKSRLNAKKIQTRYISTGIDHFISGEYPSNGCMLGYILEGSTHAIIDGLNTLLNNSSRSSERLKAVETTIPYLEMACISAHPNGDMLYHYFLCFDIVI